MLKSWITSVPTYNAYRSWLTAPDSLTARIMARSRRFRVERRFQGLGLPARDEIRMIGLHDKQLAHVREVILMADDKPVVFAHSIAAKEDLKGHWRSIGKLGNRPLAEALFANPCVNRAPLQYIQLTSAHYLHRRVREARLNPPLRLWARRSLFFLHHRPLLVTEVFLPAILSLK